MYKLQTILAGLLLFGILNTGCEKMLEVESERLVYPENHRLNSANDTLYSMVGIFTQMEKLLDRYVLLGELRGDLMDVSEEANPYLQEINNFEISPNNPVNKIEDYYAVINHCNYLINNIDTALIAKGEKIMYKEFAAAKAIRAWTYLQAVLNYGSVKYFEQPILTIQEAEDYEILTLEALLPLLIADLEPWSSVELPGSYSLGEDLTSGQLYIPPGMILGDLYLWHGQYEQAAIEYYNVIVNNTYLIPQFYSSTWTVENGVFVAREAINQSWIAMFSLDNFNLISLIARSNEKANSSSIINLGNTLSITPSSIAINNWNSQYYYESNSVSIKGDLRGDYGSYLGGDAEITTSGGSSIDYSDIFSNDEKFILKYDDLNTEDVSAAILYRASHLYLRYAEAVNRAGKPNLAFAVIKNGLNPNTMETDTIVPRHEKYISYTDTGGVYYSYTDFDDLIFEFNVGVHGLGCGNVHLSNDFRIPSLSSLEDSVAYVEEKIVEELALETAFEGNRFHDLMRISIRRNNPGYLADKVAEKYAGNKEIIRNKLMDKNNWYMQK